MLKKRFCFYQTNKYFMTIANALKLSMFYFILFNFNFFAIQCCMGIVVSRYKKLKWKFCRQLHSGLRRVFVPRTKFHSKYLSYDKAINFIFKNTQYELNKCICTMGLFLNKTEINGKVSTMVRNKSIVLLLLFKKQFS